jgi:hypothetical protein
VIARRRPEAIARCRHRRDGRDRGGVRVVAVHAVVAKARTARGVPVSSHPAVRAVSVRAVLRAVALRAELHRLAHRERRAVRQPQAGPIVRVVTGRAGALPVVEAKARVRRLGLVTRARRRHDQPLGGVTRLAADRDLRAVHVVETARQSLERERRVDLLRGLGARRVGPLARRRELGVHGRAPVLEGLGLGRARRAAREAQRRADREAQRRADRDRRERRPRRGASSLLAGSWARRHAEPRRHERPPFPSRP